MKGSFFPIYLCATVIGNKHQHNDWQKTRVVQTSCASYNCGLFVTIKEIHINNSLLQFARKVGA